MPSPTTGDILVATDASVAVVSLNRPARRNAVTLEMWRELGSLFARLGEDPGVRVIVLRGSGDHFCAGADIGEFDVARRDAAGAIAYERDVDGCTQALMAVPKPTLAAVAGFCLGGGCALAMACDFRLADASARFGIPAARLGIVYGTLDSRNLLALVGLARAKEILFGGGRFDAAAALAMGFVDRVVESPVEQAAIDWARELAQIAPLSIAGAKLILHALAAGEVEGRAEEIDAAITRAAESKDYQEGVRAFLEKRHPVFRGV
jgi:enoyl-CoA hydratase/carnithine racemase